MAFLANQVRWMKQVVPNKRLFFPYFQQVQ